MKELSNMNERERFVAVVRGDKTDYIPLFGFSGAPGMSRGCMESTHRQLWATGMPSHLKPRDVESWYRYWGTTGHIELDFSVIDGAQGVKTARREENGYVIIEGEDGSVTREVIDNDNTYSMPEYRVYPVRDRASWEFYKARWEPTRFMPAPEVEENCRRFDHRTRPLVISAGGTYGRIRSLMGVEAASVTLYDDPELIHDMMETMRDANRKYVFPLIERLRPEVVQCWEDIGFNVGLLISPDKFREYCSSFYREVADCCRACDVPLLTVDSDGCAMELAPLLHECGVNGMYPFEAKGGNDLFNLRERYPEFVMFGWLEKEVVNEGKGHLIEQEIMSKVPGLLAKGRYFPNGDHGIQPFVTFPNLCRFMTLLHEVCNNPEGEFPRRNQP